MSSQSLSGRHAEQRQVERTEFVRSLTDSDVVNCLRSLANELYSRSACGPYSAALLREAAVRLAAQS
jgi:hypothetical protein